MILLETTQKYSTHTEDEAKELMESFREKAQEKGYTIKKAGYERKTKKAKGEVVAEIYVITITQVFGDLWEDYNG